MKELRYTTNEYDWALTRCPYDTSKSNDHFENNMPYVGSGGCSDCEGHVLNNTDKMIVMCRLDELLKEIDYEAIEFNNNVEEPATMDHMNDDDMF